MSSYVLVIMLCAFLKACPAFNSVGYYFMEALRYYGQVFKAEEMLICEGMCLTFKNVITSPSDLVVIDIFMSEVNAAANITQFNKIKALLSESYTKLSSEVSLYTVLDFPHPSSFSPVVSLTN